MKTEKTLLVTACDFCGAICHFAGTPCDHCKRDACFECCRTQLKCYSHGVSFGGSGDAHYCADCDAVLKARGDERQSAYLKIERLREERTLWYEDFKRRSEAAEEAVKGFAA